MRWSAVEAKLARWCESVVRSSGVRKHGVDARSSAFNGSDAVRGPMGSEQHQRAGFAREGADTRAFAAERGELLRDELRCHVIPNDLGIGRDQHQSKRTRLSYQKSVERISMKLGKFCNTKGVNMLDGQRTGA